MQKYDGLPRLFYLMKPYWGVSPVQPQDLVSVGQSLTAIPTDTSGIDAGLNNV